MKELTLGYFINHDIWMAAKQLLDYQINDKEKHKIYNKLNFKYFEDIKKKTKITSKKSFFDERVANNLFYALKREFFFHRFTIPKTGIGLRNYVFFSYSMKLVAYSIGLYLLKVTWQYIQGKKNSEKNQEKSKIKSFYGGDLKFKADSYELILNSETTIYTEHYNDFKKELMKEEENPGNKTIIKLDIQDFFDNISIRKLLGLINDRVKHSIKQCNHFDGSTMEQIIFFYRFIGMGRDNIPQADNNIISDFISYLYLSFGDQLIEDAINEINKKSGNINDYKIVRYVDDIYISLDFKSSFDHKDCFIYQLLNKISDDFYQKLNLRFKGNAELFNIKDEYEKNEFLSNIKKVSPNYPEPESDTELTVPQKVERLFKLIDEIKSGDVTQIYKGICNEDREILKDVFDQNVDNLTSRSENIAELENKFNDFNFDLLRIYPQPLIILISKCPEAKKKLEQYLISKQGLTTFDSEMVVQLLCQTGFKKSRLFKKIKDDPQLESIFNFMSQRKVIYEEDTGYHDLSFKQIQPLIEEVSFIEQIRMRAYYEMLGQYSIALNHLLNEIQLACFILDNNGTKCVKDYNQLQVNQFLISKKVDNETRSWIEKLFDRRNTNPVAHPGSDIREAKAINENDYFEYKKYVGRALEAVTP
jgi:AbiA family abortive infection protein